MSRRCSLAFCLSALRGTRKAHGEDGVDDVVRLGGKVAVKTAKQMGFHTTLRAARPIKRDRFHQVSDVISVAYAIQWQIKIAMKASPLITDIQK